MSYEIEKWARETYVGSAAGKAILRDLAGRANEAGYCWPSQNAIAQAIECSRDTVKRWLSKMEDAGLLIREARYRSDGSRTTDGIWLLCPEIGADPTGYDGPDPTGHLTPVGGGQDAPPNEYPLEYPLEEKKKNKKKKKDVTERIDRSTVTETETACLDVLANVKGFPQNEHATLRHLKELWHEFPIADPLGVVRDYATWVEDHPIKAGSSPRSRLRNFYKNAHKWNKQEEGHTSPPRRHITESNLTPDDIKRIYGEGME